MFGSNFLQGQIDYLFHWMAAIDSSANTNQEQVAVTQVAVQRNRVLFRKTTSSRVQSGNTSNKEQWPYERRSRANPDWPNTPDCSINIHIRYCADLCEIDSVLRIT